MVIIVMHHLLMPRLLSPVDAGRRKVSLREARQQSAQPRQAPKGIEPVSRI
jgi:hypothetical protein